MVIDGNISVGSITSNDIANVSNNDPIVVNGKTAISVDSIIYSYNAGLEDNNGS